MLEAHVRVAGYRDGFTIRNLDLRVQDGEALIVTGPSGSGKTTLIRVLTGVLDRIGGFLDGEVIIDGQPVSAMEPWRIYELVAYIPQEPWYALIGYTVHSEYCYALSQLGVRCDHTSLEKLGLRGKLDSLTVNLSAGETQRLIWAEAFARRYRVLILDEPLVYLDDEARGTVAKAAWEALAHGASLVVVDHDPWFWRGMPGKLLVMENGAAKYYGEWSDEALARVEEPEVYRRRTGSGVAVEVENLWFKYPGEKPLFKGVSFTIEKSSLTGLTGRNGAGKTTLLKLMAGVLKPLKGSVRRFGRATYIPENPLLYFTKPTPREELLYAAGGRVDAVEEAVELFNLAGVLDRPLAKLSSGERRRLALASAYLGGFDIYLVDEPTGGLDQANAVRVLDALTRLVENGGTVVVATHDKRVVSLLDDDIRVGD